MNIKSLTTADIHQELQRRQKNAKTLIRKRDRLVKQLGTIETELSELGAATSRGSTTSTAAPTGRRRAKNDITLPDAIAKAMDVRAVVSPKEAAALVRSNGYKTTSKTFNMMVSNALAKDSRFKRVGRGQYERVK